MKTYIVTGGAGFIGSWVSEALQRNGHRVIIIDSFDERFSYSEKIKKRNLVSFVTENDRGFIYKEDIRDLKKMRRIFDIHKPIDGVFHLAAKAGVRPSMTNPQHYFDINVTGTLNIAKCCIWDKVPHIVYSSSSSVYGKRMEKGYQESWIMPLPKESFKETDPTDGPISPYAASKRAAELVLRPYAHCFENVSCLRFFNVYGPRMRPDAALHKFALQIHGGDPITKYGDGESWRDYTHIYDMCRGILLAMSCIPTETDEPYRIINLGAGEPILLNDLIGEIVRAMKYFNVDEEYPVTEMPEQLGDVPYTYCDISKARDLFGWSPQVSFRDGVQDFVRWFLIDFHYRTKEIPTLTFSETGL
jgi:UDP-glucuronate 4-epimerase